ncbi:hypothetical protein BpHYR1_003517 [Brachionus plicatilis]|uniref:Uncharacterized protein n=1 Tax=Brachionus plicatilis TaxID=10195 RepID=A0A3M7RVK1_BRAPC|nr:hypothetical protein BpHYR1_003517 [Brachionus plicatilis]
MCGGQSCNTGRVHDWRAHICTHIGLGTFCPGQKLQIWRIHIRNKLFKCLLFSQLVHNVADRMSPMYIKILVALGARKQHSAGVNRRRSHQMRHYVFVQNGAVEQRTKESHRRLLNYLHPVQPIAQRVHTNDHVGKLCGQNRPVIVLGVL